MYSQIDKNKQKTFFLIFFFIVFVVGIAYVIGYGWTGDRYGGIGISIMAFLFSLISGLVSYYGGAGIVLAMTRAQEVTDNPNYKELNDRVETLAIKAGIPKPKIYILPDPALNAFATGRDPNHAHLAITQGLLQAMDAPELEAVIAHEMGHIRNYDIRLMLVVSVLAGVLTYIADFFIRSMFWGGRRNNDERGNTGAIMFVFALLFAILAPIISMIIQMAISRRREFLADMTSVEITRLPDSMINALKVLAADDRPVQHATEGNAHMFIDFPMKTSGNYLKKLFSTHPPIEERIAAIQNIM